MNSQRWHMIDRLFSLDTFAFASRTKIPTYAVQQQKQEKTKIPFWFGPLAINGGISQAVFGLRCLIFLLSFQPHQVHATAYSGMVLFTHTFVFLLPPRRLLFLCLLAFFRSMFPVFFFLSFLKGIYHQQGAFVAVRSTGR